jgi:hypothetical protein
MLHDMYVAPIEVLGVVACLTGCDAKTYMRTPASVSQICFRTFQY